MPPQRTIIVDTDRIITAIADATQRQLADVNAYRDSHPTMHNEEMRQDQLAEAVWVPRNLETLAGKRLTASERIRHQQAMRKLEVDGLVVLGTRHVMLTEAGNLLAKQLTTPATPAIT